MKSIGIALRCAPQSQEEGAVCPDRNESDKKLTTAQGSGDEKHTNNPTKSTVDGLGMELHINIWKTNTSFLKRERNIYIDFGIKAPFKYDDIKIFLPFKISKNRWSDIGETICSDNKLLCALFNKDLTAIKEKNACFYRIEEIGGNNPEKDFYLYVLGENNVELEDATNIQNNLQGTWVNIKIKDHKKYLPGEIYYIRFRVELADNSQFVIRRNLSNNLIQAAFSKLDLYDIRINETRNLDKKIKESFREGNYELAVFSQFHIFYIAPIKVSIENCSNIKDDSRIIENEIWDKYEPEKTPNVVFLAHHWRKANNDEISKKINLFFTAKHPKFQFITILAYFIVVILLGTIASWLADFGVDVQSKADPSQFLWGLHYKLWIIILLVVILICWLFSGLRISGKIYWKDK